MPKGGPGIPRSEEAKKNMSAAQKAAWTPERHAAAKAIRGDLHWNTGRKMNLSDEARKEMSRRFRENNPMKNGMSDEQKKKLSEIKKGTAPRLKAYGISAERYAEEIASGNKWCCHGRHFVPGADINTSRVCSSCASEFWRKQDLQRKYGVTHEWYLAKLAEQGGACALCKITEPSAKDKNFAVDHDHKTGAPRGLLCARCNTALAKIEDDPTIMASMVAYLARYR